MNTLLFSSTMFGGLLGILLLTVAPLVRGWSKDAARMRGALRGFGLVLLFFASFGACIVLLGGLSFFSHWPNLVEIIFFICCILAVLVLWIRGGMHYRAMQRANLFSAMALAVQKQLPLAPLAEAFAAEQDGAFARRARRLANGLAAGWSLTYAVDSSEQTFPADAALATHIGEKTGNLSGALAAMQPSSGFDRTMTRPFFVRLLLLCPLGLLLVLFFSIKIMPTMLKIMDDFGLPMLPTPGDPAYPGGLLESSIGFIWNLVVSRHLGEFTVIALGGFCLLLLKAWLEWRGTQIPRLPVLKPIINGIDMGPVLRLLGLAAQAARPLPEAMRDVARYHPKHSVRLRFERVLLDISGGMPWPSSVAKHKLITLTDATILDAAQRSGNLPWALREVADGSERRAGYRLQGWTQVALPLLVLPSVIFGGLLAALCFTMMVQLIWGLAP